MLMHAHTHYKAEPDRCCRQCRSAALKKLISTNSTAGITLHQYNDMVEAGLTKAAGCSGMSSGTSNESSSSSGAEVSRSTAGMLLQTVFAGMLILLLL